MSPRAAWRLEQWGWDAYDYAGGKSDWLAWGLGYEGEADLVRGHLTSEVPTCRVDTTVGAVRASSDGDVPDGMIVVTDDRVVLGRLSAADATGADRDTPVGELMREGPTTVRPSADVSDLLHRMEHAGVSEVVVTRSDGHLLGLLEAATPVEG